MNHLLYKLYFMFISIYQIFQLSTMHNFINSKVESMGFPHLFKHHTHIDKVRESQYDLSRTQYRSTSNFTELNCCSFAQPRNVEAVCFTVCVLSKGLTSSIDRYKSSPLWSSWSSVLSACVLIDRNKGI